MLRQLVTNARQRTRARRRLLFLRRVAALPNPLRIIDLGGSVDFWRQWGIRDSHGFRITLVNPHESDKDHLSHGAIPGFMQEMDRDATLLDEQELREFDLIFSNSMLEHIDHLDARERLCRKIEMSGRPYFIQVPNKYSPIDPHYPHPLVPFFAAYPKPMKARLLTFSGLGCHSGPSTYDRAIQVLRYYNPIGPGELRSLFPSARQTAEKFMGLPLSLIAERGLSS
jgi:hypothetical protein